MAAQYLDQLVPLQGASHRDVVDYAVTVPMRNAELRARLANGRTTRLIDSRQFLGWQGYGAEPDAAVRLRRPPGHRGHRQ